MKNHYKKVFGVLLCAGVVLVGCGDKAETTVCELKQNQNGMDVNLKTTIVSKGDKVTKQKQNSVIIFEDVEQYEMVSEQMENTGLEESTKDMDGVEYEFTTNASEKRVEEYMDIDLEKISVDDYNTMTYGVADTVKISFKKSLENIKKDGYTCE